MPYACRSEGVKIMKRKQLHDNTHLTLDERKIIQAGIENGSTKVAIARTIGKDESTVAKEVRKHREFRGRNTYLQPVLCARQGFCTKKPCLRKCELFEEPKCSRRDRSPGACNKCPDTPKCRKDKYIYNAEAADKEYHRELVESREGIDLTEEECDIIGKTIAPLLEQGQSVHQVLSAHPEIVKCERTIYTYIEGGVFKGYGVDNFSLKEQVQRKQAKKKYRKRKEPANYQGRRYLDYLAFIAENPGTPTTEMDTVYNSLEGPYLQTFLFEKTGFMVGILHSGKTSERMAEGVNSLCAMLGPELSSKLLPVLLTDRGVEFEKHWLFELDTQHSPRLKIFYCDPMQSSQKPHVECNHNYVRDVIPNRFPMGCLTQADINLMFSHINSAPRRSLNDKTPFEMFCFLYGAQAPACLNIMEVKRDDVILKPSLIFANKPKSQN
jgi:IS30 family transposase